MSYILDALRRADSERERGTVPGIRAQPVPPASAAADATPRSAKPAAWLIGGLSLALVGSLLWQFMSRDDATREIVAVQAPRPAVPAAPLQAALPPALSAVPAAPAPAVAAPRPEPTRKAAPPASTRTAAKSPAPPAETSAEARVHSLQELPDEVRNELPALSIGGSIYSEHPANRFLIINGQTFRENDKIAPDLVLEQIGLKAAVLKHKNHRYRLNY